MSKAFQIKDFPDYYITDTGDVYSRNYHKTGRIKKLKTHKNKFGYPKIGLYKDGKHYNKFVHRLVAEAFIPNPENKPEINHKNGIRDDNRVENLEFATKSENMKHSYSVLHRKTICATLGKLGKDNPMSKPVLQIKDGVIVAEFAGQSEAYRKTGISRQNISICCCGRLKSAGGYQWKFKG